MHRICQPHTLLLHSELHGAIVAAIVAAMIAETVAGCWNRCADRWSADCCMASRI